MKTEIIVAEYAGFCFGVDRALKIVYNILSCGKKVVTYGEIIHNPEVVERITQRGIRTVEQLEDVPFGATLIIRSHGVQKCVYDYCAEHNIKVVDCTCEFVVVSLV